MVFTRQFTKILNKEGFTLIELLVSISILILILSLGSLANVGTLREYQISQETNYLVSNLRFLQYLSFYQKDDSSFGINLSNNQYTLFEKSSGNKIEVFRAHSLPNGLEIVGPKEISFEKDTGKPSWNGIINILDVTKQGAVFHKREININPQGNIEILQ